MPEAPSPITAVDTITPWWLDKSFLAMVLQLIVPVVASAFHVALNEKIIEADLMVMITFIIAHKAKSGAALLALIKQQADRRYTLTPVKDLPFPDLAKELDKP